MEYLRDLKKTNELAKTMVKCGIAANVVEAQDQIKKKETMLANDHNSSQADSLSVEELKEAPKEEGSDNRLGEIEDFLKKFDAFFAGFYNSTNEKLKSLTSEVEELKKQLAAVQSVPKKEAMVEEKEKPKQQEQQTVLAGEERKKEFRQKDGVYSSDDVSVSKIFNNANGRLMKK